MAKAPKRASKRTSTKQRVKVEKKVREHHRKQRRDAKKNPQWRTKKQADPGIPNSFPYKEQLLDEIRMGRDREAQRKLEERERRIAERKKGKQADSDEEGEEEDDDDDDDEVMLADEEDDAPSFAKPVTPPFYTGTLQELLDDSSVKNIVISLDARDPEAWRCEELEASAKGKGKAVHLALTRCDLTPLESLVPHLHTLAAQSSLPLYPTSGRFAAGISALATALKGKAGSAFVGFENSGRSTLATAVFNELGGEGASNVYDTTHLLPIKRKDLSADAAQDDDEEELDEEDEADEADEGSSSTDIFELQRSNAYRLLMRNKGKVERTKDPLPLLWALLPLVSQSEDLMLLYNVPAFGSYRPSLPPTVDHLTETEKDLHARSELNKKIRKDTEEFLIGLARVQGRARKHGIPDVSAAARVVLRDWSAGCLGYYTTSSEWTKIPKSEREKITLKHKADLEKKGLGKVVLSRKDWRKTFIETQKERRDLHPSPALGELRLKSAGTGALAGLDAESFEFWRPREIVTHVEEDEEAEIEGLVEEGDDDEEEEDDDDEDEDEDMPEDDEEEEDEVAPPPKSAMRRAARQAKVKSLSTLGPAVSEKKKRVRMVEPSKKERRRIG